VIPAIGGVHEYAAEYPAPDLKALASASADESLSSLCR
jgi:hypothetical protein